MDEPTPLDTDGIVGSLTGGMLEKQEREEGVVESDGCKFVNLQSCWDVKEVCEKVGHGMMCEGVQHLCVRWHTERCNDCVCVHACLRVFIHACVCVFSVHLQIVSLCPTS